MYLSNELWDQYKDILNEFSLSTHTEDIEYYQLSPSQDRFGEGSGNTYSKTDLKFSPYFNFFRTWPINTETATGDIDKQNMVAIFNIKALSTLGLLINGRFKINSGDDFFIYRGEYYEIGGETPDAVANGDILNEYLILKKVDSKTHNLQIVVPEQFEYVIDGGTPSSF